MEKVLFSQVCVCSQEGTPIRPMGVSPSSQWGVPHPADRGYPHPANVGYSSQVSMGYPLADWKGYPTPAVQDGGTLPLQDWMGVPPLPCLGDGTAQRVLAMRWAVCLLRSGRRTFLFKIWIFIITHASTDSDFQCYPFPPLWKLKSQLKIEHDVNTNPNPSKSKLSSNSPLVAQRRPKVDLPSLATSRQIQNNCKVIRKPMRQVNWLFKTIWRT